MRTPAELMAATQMHFAQLRAGGLLPNHPVAGMQLANMHNLLAGQQASQQPKTQSAEHKKKLLWSGKKTETAQATSATATTWANADLGDAARKEKFLKLMGAKKKENEALLQAPPPPPTEAAGPGQDKLFQELEREFMAGIGQGTSAKGLGFNW